jgi:uncharacterized membrane protein
MNKKYINYLLVIFFLVLSLSTTCFAQDEEEIFQENIESSPATAEVKEEFFKAKIIEILEEKEITQADGSKTVGQKIKLIGLEGEFKDKEIIYDGINENINYSSKNIYHKDDRVSVSKQTINGTDSYSIVDYVRSDKIYWLSALFALSILLIGRWQGFRSLLGLVFSFFVILKFIIPGILGGKDPLSTTIFYALIIIVFSTYLIYGLNKKSNIAIIGTFFGLLIVGLLSLLFTKLMHLSGISGEETMFIVDIMKNSVNLKGLMLSGFIIGALGVLDDITVSQASTVIEIQKANPDLEGKEIFKRAMRVGIDHISSMVNTLFLAYAGAFLPLLILFNIKQPPFMTFSQVINSEIIATEIVRTFVGSIGLAVAVPITTLIAAYIVKKYYDQTL